MIKIVADENIELIREAFADIGELSVLPGRKISKKELLDADALLVRSVTKVNKDLLEGTKIRFVGTATIGNDHIDKEYLASRKIFFTDAAGCNSDAVAEYVFTALFHLADKLQFNLNGKTLGIIGAGNIGSRVARMAVALGMLVLKNDPPMKRSTLREDYLELDELMNADIITLHVPLIKEGVDKTYHLFDRTRLKNLKDGTIIINTSRGPVIDNNELIKSIDEKNLIAVLDVWEDEPDINLELLEKVKLATPHIAGYSLEGKVNGTIILYNSLCNFLKIIPRWKPVLPKPQRDIINLPATQIEKSLNEIFSHIYRIDEDDRNLRKIKDVEDSERGDFFDSLRKNYTLRRELPNYKIKIDHEDKRLEKILKTFRCDII